MRPLDPPAEPEPQPTPHKVEAALKQERFSQEIWTILIGNQPTTTVNSQTIFI